MLAKTVGHVENQDIPFDVGCPDATGLRSLNRLNSCVSLPACLPVTDDDKMMDKKEWGQTAQGDFYSHRGVTARGVLRHERCACGQGCRDADRDGDRDVSPALGVYEL
jgi:hypothetical protein